MNQAVELSGIDQAVVERFALDAMPFGDRDRPIGDLLDLSGRTVVVTGGGGGCLGQALVNRFASAGANVAVLDLELDVARGVAETASKRWGVRTFATIGDVTDWDDIHNSMSRVQAELGGMDVLVNNAGGALRSHGSFLGLAPDAISKIIALNLTGTAFATRAALEVMLPGKSGRIINIASEGGKTRVPGLTVYNSCKSGVIGFTRNLAEDLRGTGISTVALCPGVMVGPHALERLRGGATPQGRAALEYSFDTLNLGRYSLPEEVANMAVVLASPAGAYTSGTAVSVGGGLSD
ncbi:SDR family NAD(P)-dependent oxidoreductase [Rhodococcus sp. NPDC057529]|uniref:SDR family NAD(P)-dependent oxidoreductase n=1 Tax=Rhodococcus sp. NPDC057529 TaxID=3346158 RepID=UPI00366C1335